jgi:Pyruvate/2-oxoacid:ferredoxin oxidoreductase gamma subunit
VDAQRRVREEMVTAYPLGVYRDRTGLACSDACVRPSPPAPPRLEELPGILGLTTEDTAAGGDPSLPLPASDGPAAVDARLKIAGFGGQGVLLLGEVLAEAGLAAGLEVSWLPSYGPEMRSGTSNCHVRLSRNPIDSPLVSVPNVLLALNEPSLRKFIGTVQPGGWVIYNGAEVPADCARADIQTLALPFTQMADELGAAKAGNMAMLGALSGARPRRSAEVGQEPLDGNRPGRHGTRAPGGGHGNPP